MKTIVGIAIAIALFAGYALAQGTVSGYLGTYQIGAGSRADAWRVNTVSGEMVYCQANIQGVPRCSRVWPEGK